MFKAPFARSCGAFWWIQLNLRFYTALFRHCWSCHGMNRICIFSGVWFSPIVGWYWASGPLWCIHTRVWRMGGLPWLLKTIHLFKTQGSGSCWKNNGAGGRFFRRNFSRGILLGSWNIFTCLKHMVQAPVGTARVLVEDSSGGILHGSSDRHK